MKACLACNTEKPLTEFSKRKDRKDGLHFWCKPCLKIKKAESYQRTREKALATMAVYRKANPEKVSEGKKKCYRAKPEQYAARAKAKYDANPEHYVKKTRQWLEQNKERSEATQKAYREKNRRLLVEKATAYVKANREKVSAYQLRYRHERRKEDPLFALVCDCRGRLLSALRKGGYRKSSKTESILGCSFEELKAHLESKFQPGMTWDNRGMYGWHVDHVLPLSSASDREGIEKLCHYTNLQPLWAEDNWAKNDKMPEDEEGTVWRGRQLNSSSPGRSSS